MQLGALGAVSAVLGAVVREGLPERRKPRPAQESESQAQKPPRAVPLSREERVRRARVRIMAARLKDAYEAEDKHAMTRWQRRLQECGMETPQTVAECETLMAAHERGVEN